MVILGLETGKQSGESMKCFPTERSLPRGVFETSCAGGWAQCCERTHAEKDYPIDHRTKVY